MPDWAYRTVMRPLLFRVAPEAARDFTLGAMGSLDALPGGPALIEFFGHMLPPAEVRKSLLGIDFPGPVGLGAGLDLKAEGASALSRFGFGFMELGPVTAESRFPENPVERILDGEALCYNERASIGIDALVRQIEKLRPLTIPLGFRLSAPVGSSPSEAAAEWRLLHDRLLPYAQFLSLDPPDLDSGRWAASDWLQALADLMPLQTPCPVLLCVRPSVSEEAMDAIILPSLEIGLAGIIVAEDIADEDQHRLVGPIAFEKARDLVRALRRSHGKALPIIVGGGIHQPVEALEMREAGADLIQIHSGLVYSGPGLPKRINEAIAYRQFLEHDPAQPASEVRTTFFSSIWDARPWLAFVVIALILLISGAAAWHVAATSVVLPYDEAYVQSSRQQLDALNPHLLDFMAHDRVTLAGTMLSTGLLYFGLAVFAVRNGMSWARAALSVSCVVGVLSFFLFVGFGYLDLLHAFLTATIVPPLLLALSSRLPPARPITRPNLTNNPEWLQSQWGQLLFIMVGFGLAVGGITIALVGTVNVFVPEDLQFMATTREALNAFNPRLISLIAHDRVGFGGDLAANGIAVLMISMWGFRQGARWIWWTLLGAGLVGFVGTLGVHIEVGYTDLIHLAPVVLAVVLFVIALACSRSYLFRAPDDAAS